MDKDEAGEILARTLSDLRTRSYDDLRSMMETVRTETVESPSGAVYQIEIQVFWDDKPEQDLRVMGSIDDGGLSALRPLSDDFIIAPDGSLVGE